MWVTLLVVVGLAVLAGCIYVLPQVLVPDRSAASLAAVPDAAKRVELEDARLKQRNDVRTTLLQGLAGAVVAIGLSLTWRQIRVSQEGQFYERFKDAIDQLGSDTLDLRLGGIYALERIAKDSDDDRGAIAEILTAFVRHRTPWPPILPGQYVANSPIRQQPELRTRAPDIQAVLTVLGRGAFTRQGDSQLDLGGVDLRNSVLLGAHLEGANLRGAHLEGALLLNAHLERASLIDANLDSAILQGANVDDAYLQRANLDGAYLQRANLSGAQLYYANLSGAHLEGANLSGAHLDHANVSGAHLEGANLSGAHLQRTDLDGAYLLGAVADVRTEWPGGFDTASKGIQVH